MDDDEKPSRRRRPSGEAEPPVDRPFGSTGSGDELLRMLGAIAADQQRAGNASRWERMTRSELTPEEIAELERLADAAEERELLIASRPLDAQTQDRIAGVLATRIAPSRRPVHWRYRVGIAAGSLALAAGVSLFVKMSGSERLPSYALEWSGASSSRGPRSSIDERACVLRASERGSFEVVLRPHDAVSGTVVARAFLNRGGDVEPWNGELSLSPNGSVRLLEKSQKLAGASELRIVVGRPEHLTADGARTLARGSSTAGRGWQVLRCAVETL